MKYNLSIVVPCYNEGKNLPILIENFSNAIKTKGIELLIVNNGSTDKSSIILNQLAKKYAFVRIITIKKNVGYGHGIVTGLKKAKGDYLAWTHADLQTNPSDVIKAFDIIKKQGNPQICYIKGSRKNRHFVEKFFSIGMAGAAALILAKPMYDINAQPNLFHKSFLGLMRNPPTNFFLDLYAYYSAKKSNIKIIKFPVYFGKRAHGISHWDINFSSKLKLIKDMIKYMIILRKQG